MLIVYDKTNVDIKLMQDIRELTKKQEEYDKYFVCFDIYSVNSEMSLTIKYKNVDNIEYYTKQKVYLRNIEIICSEKVKYPVKQDL